MDSSLFAKKAHNFQNITAHVLDSFLRNPTCYTCTRSQQYSVTFDLLILKIMFLFFKNTVKILKFR